MYDWIILLSLCVAGLCAASIGAVLICCRRMRLEKIRRLADALHEQDRLSRELEHARIEKRTLERVLADKLPAREADENGTETHL